MLCRQRLKANNMTDTIYVLLIRHMVEKGASYTEVDHRGMTPLMLAAGANNELAFTWFHDMAASLRENGFNLNVRNYDDRNVLNLVESKNASPSIREMLYKLKAAGLIEAHVPASQWSVDGGHCRGGTSSAIKQKRKKRLPYAGWWRYKKPKIRSETWKPEMPSDGLFCSNKAYESGMTDIETIEPHNAHTVEPTAQASRMGYQHRQHTP